MTSKVLAVALTGIFCVIIVLLFVGQWKSQSYKELIYNDFITPPYRVHKEFVTPSATTSTTIPNVNWSDVFKFVPNMLNNCDDLFKEKLVPEQVKEKFSSMENFQQKENIEITEGHSGRYWQQQRLFYEILQNAFVTTVCETGFNAGHSSLMWLQSNPAVHVYSFDLGKHDYAKTMAYYLQSIYPGRLTVTWGDSQSTLPEFTTNHTDIKCDIIFIDGGHTTNICLSDFYNFKKMANKNHILILDNYPDARFKFDTQIGNCWEKVKREGEVLEMFNCNYKPADMLGMGFTVARYNI